MPEEKRKRKKLKIYLKIMRENFSSLAKEIDFQEAQRVPKKLAQGSTHQGTS